MIAIELNIGIDLFQLMSESHSTEFNLETAKAYDNFMKFGADVQIRKGESCAMSVLGMSTWYLVINFMSLIDIMNLFMDYRRVFG